MWCRAVLCLGLRGGGPALSLAGRWLASCWVLGASPVLLGGAGTAALSTCIMHDHVNGGWACSPLPHGPPPLPTPDRQGHSPRCDRMRNLNGFTQRPREREKKRARAGICLGAPRSGMGKAWGIRECE